MSEESQVQNSNESVLKDPSLAISPEKMTDKDVRYREKYKFKVQEHESYKLQAEAEKKELAKKAESFEKRSQGLIDKVVSAKLESAAVAAGIADIDFVKLIDKSQLKTNSDGEVEGLAEAVNELKSKKPHCFGEPKKTSSSSNATTSVPVDTKPKDAFDMSPEEFSSRTGIKLNNRF